MSTIKVNAIQDTSGNTLERVLQKETTSSTTKLLSTSTSYVELMNDTITTSVANSKILIFCQLSISKQDNHSFIGRLLRGSTEIAGGVKDSSSQLDGVWWNTRSSTYSATPETIVYLDSPSAASGTSITYTAQGLTTDSGYSFGFNRNINMPDQVLGSPVMSNLVLLELPA
tara:strand:+ start:207 stop:719 length:513 start_codon:yes stop_codon:yes gene_type:complete